jgi:hypothetical protein
LSAILLVGLAFALSLSGCAGSSGRTFVHPDYDFGFVQRVAVVPFENLTENRGAGARMTRNFVAELLATMAFDVVEPGEVVRAMEAHSIGRTSELDTEQIRALGKDLKCQALFLGSVTEASTERSSGNSLNTVSLEVRLVETETGAAVWSTSQTRAGRGFFSGLFGTSGKPMSEVSRDCARACIEQLVH